MCNCRNFSKYNKLSNSVNHKIRVGKNKNCLYLKFSGQNLFIWKKYLGSFYTIKNCYANAFIQQYVKYMMDNEKERKEPIGSCSCHEEEGFGGLIKFTLPGFAGGIIIGALFDYFGYQLSVIGQIIVRTMSGEGESILEGVYSIRKRLSKSAGSLAEAYGWGKLLGMMFPWVVDLGSRWLGLDVYSIEAFYIPYFYALSDQIGANVSGFIYLNRKSDSLSDTLKAYFKNPVMLTSLAIILLAPLGLLMVRVLGFSPITQKLTAFETIAANLCWLPPVVGWLRERSARNQNR